jgi:hypothetical protein
MLAGLTEPERDALVRLFGQNMDYSTATITNCSSGGVRIPDIILGVVVRSSTEKET